jgi:2-polyprenyl-3-methyl-5-hydroxy-6-metoxy-1,4-benzoquinol methylase
MEVVHGHGERFAPELGQEAPMAEQFARLDFVCGHIDFADKKVLDCGCGTGYSLAHIASLFPTADYVGIDADQGAIDYAANRYPSMDYVVMNALDISFPAASFDIVLSFEVLEHLTKSEQERYLSEMSRVLRPGGTLVLSTPNRDVFSLGYTESLNPYHLNELTLPEMRRLLEAHFHDPTIYGQFFANIDAREKDFAQLRNRFTTWKRIKRHTVGTLRRSGIGEAMYSRYERLKTSMRGPRTVYPFAIRKEDFGFGSDNMNIAKWFLCLCTARARSLLMWVVVFTGV